MSHYRNILGKRQKITHFIRLTDDIKVKVLPDVGLPKYAWQMTKSDKINQTDRYKY